MSSIKRGDVIDFNAARGVFAFTMRIDNREFSVHVSDKVLRELCRRGHIECAAREEAFRILRSPIEDLFLQKLQQGVIELDGSISIDLADLKSGVTSS